ncbi:MAG: DUF452 family protein, partial [Muribaculaceae bacterium]|nr:DUF452 family protein [Muribaculaceae bacterium]
LRSLFGSEMCIRDRGYDIAVIWDYRSLTIDWTFCNRYCEICIVAWSLGVYASAVTTHPIEQKVTRRIAVNGTLYPVDRLRGIPEATFAGTLDGLTERSLHKFYRRMAGSKERFDTFAATMPQRDIEGLKEELLSFYPFPLMPCTPVARWDTVIAGREDAIFPAVNQARAWYGYPVTFVDEPHLMDFQKIIDRYIIDKQRTGERFSKGMAGSYHDAASVQAAIVGRIDSLLGRADLSECMAHQDCHILEIGSGSGLLSRCLYARKHRDALLEMWDLAAEAPFTGADVTFASTDAELGIWQCQSASVDIIASASTIQWFNSPTRFLTECQRVLKPGGYAVLSTFVKGNLNEVSQAGGRALPLLSASQWRAIIPDGLHLVYDCDYSHTLSFDSAIEVFRHLKATGVNSLDRTASDGASLRSILTHYREALDGRYRATYRPIILILHKAIQQ